MSLDPITMQIAMSLASQGMRMWADFAERVADGQTTDEELDAMAAKLDINLQALREEIAAAKAAGR